MTIAAVTGIVEVVVDVEVDVAGVRPSDARSGVPGGVGSRSFAGLDVGGSVGCSVGGCAV
jgi:hypothetical protein